jgi:hypothetical protein
MSNLTAFWLVNQKERSALILADGALFTALKDKSNITQTTELSNYFSPNKTLGDARRVMVMQDELFS